MPITALPPRALVRELLDYDAATGFLTWRPRRREMFATAQAHGMWNAVLPGGPAGSIDHRTKRTIVIFLDRKYQAHRLIWLHAYGEPVPPIIDHADGNPSNNRLANLRSATQSQNMANAVKRIDNTTGLKGVHFLLRTRRFRAYINHDSKRVHLGYFKTAEEAADARRVAAIRLHGPFARHD